jgi:hypothetical protein
MLLHVPNALVIFGHRHTISNPIRHCKTVDERDHEVAGILEFPIADLMLRLVRVRMGMRMQHKSLLSHCSLDFRCWLTSDPTMSVPLLVATGCRGFE